MKLKDTVEWMLSEDYKERFKAEYYQLKIRTANLELLLEKAKKEELSFEFKCPEGILNCQLSFMKRYLAELYDRAYYEGIIL